MICTSCGAENELGSRFCDNCAAALRVPCDTCGAPNRPEARFCRSCATPLGANVEVARSARGAASTRAGTPTPQTAERRLVSVLFADLVGFTTLAEDRDPEAVRELLNRYFAVATDVVQRHGGTIEKFIGDAVMAVWGTPIAHEDDAERAVRSALELVDAVGPLHPNLHARAGVLTGEAAVTVGAQNQGMVAGDLVNTAARLQGVAEPGTVLVGEPTKRAAERAIVFEEVGEHSLKGKTTPVPAWRAVRVVAQRGGQGRADALEPPFVGRDEELRQLKEHLHAVGRERRVRLVSVTGPGGIGKSRLVWELEKYVDGVAEPIYWHRGRSPSYGEGITFWALGEMVRRRAKLAEEDDEETTRMAIAATVAEHVSDDERASVEHALLALLGIEPAPPGGRDALFPAWRTFFERIATRGTTVLVFEDLQWADSGLLEFIDHVVEWSRALPILVVTLARPELFDRRPDWGAARRNFSAMSLEPLSPRAMRQMLGGLVPGLPEAAVDGIVERADGVPLYAVETVRSLLAEGRIRREGETYRPTGDLTRLAVPESLRSLIASRLDSLESDDRSLLQTASVLGQVFAGATLAAVANRTEAELEPRLRALVRRELLEVETDPASPERGQYRFVQSLIREVAYGILARPERRARHLAVARYYETLADEELPGALASHYLAAYEASEEGPEAEAVAAQARLALRAAADRAASLGSHRQALSHIDRALGITHDSGDRADLLERAARSASAAGATSSEDYARRAVEAREEAGDLVGAFRATALLAQVLVELGKMPDAAAAVEEALARPDRPPDETVDAELHAQLARAYMRSFDFERAIVAADHALTIAERLNLERVVVEALNNKASSLGGLGRRREATGLMETALRLCMAGGWSDLELRLRNNLANSVFDDEPARAAEITRSAAELARHVGHRGMFAWLAGTSLGFGLLGGRRWDEDVALVDEAIALAENPEDVARLKSGKLDVQTARGETDTAMLEELTRAAEASSDPIARVAMELNRADVEFVLGQYEQAAERALRAAAAHEALRDYAVTLAGLAASIAGSVEHARAALTQADLLAGTGRVSSAIRMTARARLLALEGKHGEALQLFRSAIQEWRDMQQDWELARVALSAVVLLPNEETRRWADEAHAVFERVGAHPFLKLLDSIVTADGRRPAEQRTTPEAAHVPEAAG